MFSLVLEKPITKPLLTAHRGPSSATGHQHLHLLLTTVSFTSLSSQPRLNGVCNPPSHPLSSLPGVEMLAPVLCHLSESILLSLAYTDKSVCCHVTLGC